MGLTNAQDTYATPIKLKQHPNKWWVISCSFHLEWDLMQKINC